MRLVRLLERGDFVSGQGQRLGGERVLQVLLPRRTDDGCGHPGLGEHPGQGYLRRRYTACRGDLGRGVDHVEVGRLVVEVIGERVGARARGEPTAVARAVASQHSPRQGAPGNAAHALVQAERDHLALFLAVDEVVVVLHGDELRPAVQLCRVLRLGELPREHAARPDVTRLA